MSCTAEQYGLSLCLSLSFSLTSFWFAMGTPVRSSSFSLRPSTAVPPPTPVTTTGFPRNETCSSISPFCTAADSADFGFRQSRPAWLSVSCLSLQHRLEHSTNCQSLHARVYGAGQRWCLGRARVGQGVRVPGFDVREGGGKLRSVRLNCGTKGGVRSSSARWCGGHARLAVRSSHVSHVYV